MNTARLRHIGSRLILETAFFLSPLFGLCTLEPAKAPAPDRNLYRSWMDHERYAGSPDSSPITPVDFQQLAYELQAFRSTRTTASNLSAPQRSPYETVSVPRNNLRNRIPLSIIHWKRTLEVVTPEQQRQARATGVAPEPVLTNVTILAVAPVRPVTYRGASVAISLAADDFFEETGATNTIRSLRIDTGDGAGWQDMAVGQEFTAAYDSTGTKTITIEATLSDGTVLLASSPLEVAALATPDPTISTRLIADYPYNNTTGTVYVYKSGSHTGLRCPVLVAEGFDMENNMDWDVLYNILNKEQLAETLRSYGRDLIVLDYTNAMRNIFENAALARKAITYINANRSNSSDKFTVIGASMGGLVTRIALADMDRFPIVNGVSDVNTWISFDSPHSGANIPLGIQEFLAFFYYKDSAFAAAAKLYDILNQPAAKQMLLVHHSTTTSLAGNSSNINFQATLDAKGYPTSCKKVAISNGSGYGHKQPFNPGELVVFWHYRNYWVVDIDGLVYSLSDSPSPTVPTIFYGFWDTIAWFDEVSTSQQHYFNYSLDNAPGGTRNSFQVLFDSTASRRGSGDYCLWPDHCFIPTVSSLGINIAYCSYALNSYPGIKALSPFNEVHYANGNEPHIDINYNNKRWFMRAILEGYDTDADGLDDYKEYLIGTAYNSAASKLEVVTTQTQVTAPGNFELSWNWNPNVSYKVFFTETLAHEWTLVPTAYWYRNWDTLSIARCTMPMTTQTGFYKVVADVEDPVTN